MTEQRRVVRFQRARRCAPFLPLVAAAIAGCGQAPPAATAQPFSPLAPHELEKTALGLAENARMATADLASAAPPGQIFGPDPVAIISAGDDFIGVLAGASAVVAIDGNGAELSRAPAPPSPTAITRTAAGEIIVAAGPTLARYAFSVGDSPALTRHGGVTVNGAVSLRDVAASDDPHHPRTIYATDEATGAILAIELPDLADHQTVTATPKILGHCRGPHTIRTSGSLVIANCLLDHALVGWRVATGGISQELFRITSAGPMWTFAVAPKADSGGNVLLAATGIEDHPRVKTEGAFQYIDSFVYLYEITPIGHAERLAAVDVSALGVVTPKWLHMTQGAGGGLEIKTSGYGAENLATLRWPPGQLSSPPVTATRAIVPGIAAAVLRAPGLVGADPLLDAWVIVAPKRQPAVVAVPAPKTARTLASRIGEAIFFSTLATPDSKADGPSSRFSCEACHYDGYVDGRTHFTGKKKVPAVTMPLHGLFGNRPHYSHALVPTLADLSSVVLMLVNLPTGIDPWFSIARADAPWLRYLGKVPERISPLAVREALMAFFVDYAQRPNPAVAGRSAFSATERRGAEVFHKLCARCHAPRLFADDPKTAAPFADWEKRIFSPQGPLVWASASYAKTGITPYFHKLGTRVPSLRRLYTKAPYFTNGAAENLAAVLSRAAASRGTFYHDGAPPEATRIPADDQLALAAFLRLL